MKKINTQVLVLQDIHYKYRSTCSTSIISENVSLQGFSWYIRNRLFFLRASTGLSAFFSCVGLAEKRIKFLYAGRIKKIRNKHVQSITIHLLDYSLFSLFVKKFKSKYLPSTLNIYNNYKFKLIGYYFFMTVPRKTHKIFFLTVNRMFWLRTHRYA